METEGSTISKAEEGVQYVDKCCGENKVGRVGEGFGGEESVLNRIINRDCSEKQHFTNNFRR